MKITFIIMLLILSASCSSQEKEVNKNKRNDLIKEVTNPQIGEYVTSAFEDSKGDLWFGTLEKGMAKYDGNQLKYFTKEDGLPSNRVTSVVEDDDGVFWFNTGNGLSKFDGTNFTNFRIKEDGFLSNMVSQFFIDGKGEFWIGTWGGVYRFDGKIFTHFPIPYPKVETKINEDTKTWITEIEEDVEGNMWFGRDGYGACKYDGKAFTHFLKKDGLHSNNITEIEMDEDGSIWIGTRVAERDNPDPDKRIEKGGINKLTKNGIISFPDIEGFNNGDVYNIYKDSSKNIWISTTKNGVYRYDGKAFKNYNIPISVMGMTNDKNGNFWLGGAGGLYRIHQDGEIVNVRRNGPWK